MDWTPKGAAQSASGPQKWLSAAAVAVLVAGISLGVSWWVYHSRTVKAIGDQLVQQARITADRAVASEREARGQLSSTLKQLQDTANALAAKDQEVAALNNRVSELTTRTSAADNEVSRLKTALADAERTTQATKAEIDKLTREAKQSTSKISALEAQLNQDVANKAKLQAEVQSLTEQLRGTSTTTGPTPPAKVEMDTIVPCTQPETVVLVSRSIRQFKVRGVDLFLYVQEVKTLDRVDVYLIRTQNPDWANAGRILDREKFKTNIEHSLTRAENGTFPPNSFGFYKELTAKRAHPVIEAHFPEGDSIRLTLQDAHFVGEHRAQFEICRQ
jgi:hypothetical protein